MRETRKVDVIIIGAGSGNRTITSALDDQEIVIAESRRYGGTCLNYGCIPSKMLARTAALARAPEEAGRLNVDLRFEGANWPAIRERIFTRIDDSTAEGQQNLEERKNVTWIEDEVRLDGPKTIVLSDGRRFEGKQIVLAAGSRPTIPHIPGAQLPGVYTSDEIMRVKEFPRRLVVIGSGPVGCEFASIFSGLGSSVTQIARSGRLMKSMGETTSKDFTEQASEHWTVVLNEDVRVIEEDGNGLAVVTSSARYPADAVLLAVGRTSNADRLGAKDAWYDLDEKGNLVIDDCMRAQRGGIPEPGAYGLGDLVGGAELKHVANYEALVVAWNLAHPEALREVDDRPLAHVTFTTPELASVGLTEEEAKDRFGEDSVAVVTQEYADATYGWAMENTTGRMTLVGNLATGELVGAQIIGQDASGLLQPLTMAISFGINPRSAVDEQYWVHPAFIELARDGLWALADRMGL